MVLSLRIDSYSKPKIKLQLNQKPTVTLIIVLH